MSGLTVLLLVSVLNMFFASAIVFKVFDVTIWKQGMKLCDSYITFTFSHLADTFIQSDLQMRTMEAIRINKRAMIPKCYNKSQLS